jgi:SAM-dependent methyltransferase
MDKHWTDRLFLDKAALFMGSLEGRLEGAVEEVEGLLKIFSEHNVPEGGSVLDLACGIGRHSVLLAEKGYKTVGVDISPTYISRAKELADERSVSQRVEFVVGDMRKVRDLLKDRGEGFDVAVNLLTSHGYWDEETDREIFRQTLDLAKPNGIFIIHTVNRDYLVRNFQARDWTPIQEGRFMTMERRLDLENSRMFVTWKYYEQQGEDLIHAGTAELDHRVYSIHELRKQVEDSGWEPVSCYGDFDMQPLTMDSEIILVAKKPA